MARIRAALVTCIVLALVLLVPIGRARATTDSGQEARLIALAGMGQRYAIVAIEDIHEPCVSAGCRVYHVDLHQAWFRRLGPAWVSPPDDESSWSDGEAYDAAVAAAYLKTLGKRERRRLTPLGPLGAALKPLPAKGDLDRGAVIVRASTRSVVVAAEPLWAVDSMAPYDRETEQPCWTSSEATLCSTCEYVERWFDGERRSTLRCRDAVGHREMSGAKAACNCHARGRMFRLRATDQATGKAATGNRFLVEPHALGQLVMAWLPDDTRKIPLPMVSLCSPESANWPFVTAHETSSGAIVVVGSAQDAPSLNATLFATIVTMPPPGKRPPAQAR